MAVYKEDVSGDVSLKEQGIFGSDRLGLYSDQKNEALIYSEGHLYTRTSSTSDLFIDDFIIDVNNTSNYTSVYSDSFEDATGAVVTTEVHSGAQAYHVTAGNSAPELEINVEEGDLIEVSAYIYIPAGGNSNGNKSHLKIISDIYENGQKKNADYGFLYQNSAFGTGIPTEEWVKVHIKPIRVSGTTSGNTYTLKSYANSWVHGTDQFYVDDIEVKVTKAQAPTTVESGFIADVTSYQNYYPFGMQQPTRGENLEYYRYGFNGKEKDPEGMGGGGTTYDYGFRIYNPQIAKFLSVDPLNPKYPWYTPYQFAGNKPIAASDLDGLEERIEIVRYYGDGVEFLQVYTKNDAEFESMKNAFWGGFNYPVYMWQDMDEYDDYTFNCSSNGCKKSDALFIGTLRLENFVDGSGTTMNIIYNKESTGDYEAKSGWQLSSFSKSYEIGMEAQKWLWTGNDSRAVAFRTTFTNYFKGGAASVFGVGVAGYIGTTTAAEGLLVTKFGKGSLDILKQVISNRGFSDIDWADAAISAMGGNKYVSTLAKSFINYQNGNITFETLQKGFTKFGLSIVKDKIGSGENETNSFIIDVIKDETEAEAYELIK